MGSGIGDMVLAHRADALLMTWSVPAQIELVVRQGGIVGHECGKFKHTVKGHVPELFRRYSEIRTTHGYGDLELEGLSFNLCTMLLSCPCLYFQTLEYWSMAEVFGLREDFRT